MSWFREGKAQNCHIHVRILVEVMMNQSQCQKRIKYIYIYELLDFLNFNGTPASPMLVQLIGHVPRGLHFFLQGHAVSQRL